MAKAVIVFALLLAGCCSLVSGLTCNRCSWGEDPNHAGGGGDTRCKNEADDGVNEECPGVDGNAGYCLHQITRLYGTPGPVYRSCVPELPPNITTFTEPETCYEELSGATDDIKIKRCYCRVDGCNAANSIQLAGLSMAVVLIMAQVA